MKFLLNETVTTYPDEKVYEAEVGTITDVFFGLGDHVFGTDYREEVNDAE